EFLQHADFDTPYKEGQHRLPLGEEPLLVTDVEAKPVADGPLRLVFNEQPPQGDAKPRSFEMEMQAKLMQGLMHLLDQALLQSQWRESFVPATPAEPSENGDADPSRPRYLN